MGLFDMFKSKKPAPQAPVPQAPVPPAPAAPAVRAVPAAAPASPASHAPASQAPAQQGDTTAARANDLPGPQQPAAQPTAPSPSAARPTAQPITEGPGDGPITQLSLAADPANRPSWDALWKAVFALPAWHFVTATSPGSEPQAVRTTMDGRSCVLIYTSAARAAAARGHYAQAMPKAEVAARALSVTQAAEYVCSMRKDGPGFVLFNQGTAGKGFAESIPSIATMIEYMTGTLPAGCIARFIQAGNQMQHPEVWRRLKMHLARLPRWYMLTDPERRDLPQLIETDGQNRTTMYSGEHEAKIAVAAMGQGGPGNVPAILELTPKEGADMLKKARQMSGGRVSEVVLNFGSEGVALGIDSVVEAVNAR